MALIPQLVLNVLPCDWQLNVDVGKVLLGSVALGAGRSSRFHQGPLGRCRGETAVLSSRNGISVRRGRRATSQGRVSMTCAASAILTVADAGQDIRGRGSF